jgi:hypothetical protein
MTRRARRLVSRIGLAAALLAAAPGTAVACPSCKQALGTNDRWQTAFNASVLFMMSMPFAVVGVVAGAVWRAQRRKRREDAPADLPPAA